MCLILYIAFFLKYAGLMLHPLHISVVTIDENPSNNKFEITIKLFKDDFEKNAFQNYNIKLNIGTPEEIKNCDEYISRYINDKIEILIDNNKSIFMFNRKEIKDDAVWFYLEIKEPKVMNKIIVKNKLFLDIFEDQKNLLIVTFEGKQFAKQLNTNNNIAEFSLK